MGQEGERQRGGEGEKGWIKSDKERDRVSRERERTSEKEREEKET